MLIIVMMTLDDDDDNDNDNDDSTTKHKHIHQERANQHLISNDSSLMNGLMDINQPIGYDNDDNEGGTRSIAERHHIVGTETDSNHNYHHQCQLLLQIFYRHFLSTNL